MVARAGRDGERRTTRWQAELWRRLRDADRRARARPSGSSARARGCAPSRELVDLPAALSLFGLTRLPAGHLDVLRALAAGRDVHLFLLHPSPALWERGRRARTGRRSSAAPTTRPPTLAAQPAARLVGAGRARDAARARAAAEHVDHHHPVDAPRRTRCSRASRPTCAPTAAAGAPLPATDAARCSTRRPQRAGPRLPRPRPPGRGRCATRSCTCSPRTRRSSRATSSSCARTSRRSRR